MNAPAAQLRRDLAKAAGAVERLRARVKLMRKRLDQAEVDLAAAKRTLKLLADAAVEPEPSVEDVARRAILPEIIRTMRMPTLADGKAP